MPQLNLAQATAEVRRGADAVRRSVGNAGLLFRPSGTPSSTATIRVAAAAAGYARCVGYSVDPADYTDPGADLVLHRTLDAVKPGSIVSLHLGHAGTITALPGILAGLQARGLASVTMSRLLA
jgi:peptidoglycan/xylan/chitin deacetylase (PgdA/CDA1 family)